MQMNIPGFSAEASLYKSGRTYRLEGGLAQSAGVIHPAGGLSPSGLLQCLQSCGDDSDCFDCCICLARGGSAPQCCF